MFQYPYINLFMMTLVSSTLMALSSSHWLMVWMSLELNMLSFIPILASTSWFQESEAALKYLLFQAFGSSLILLSMVDSTMATIALFGLLTKLGAAPFHFWFPSVMKSSSWMNALFLMTWQKIAPLMLIIFSFADNKPVMISIGVFSALIGGLGGLNQTHFRALLAYSSIGHMGWMIATAAFSPFVSALYFLFYLLISTPIVWASFLVNIQSLKLMNAPRFFIYALLILPCTLSLSGLPPLTGFTPKLLALFSISSLMLSILLILGSLINLSYYLNFFFTLFMASPAYKYNALPINIPLPLTFLAFVAYIPLPPLFILFCLL